MAKGYGGGFGGGGPNLNNLMKQAQKMQRDMEVLQEELANKTVEASVGGGAVTVVALCNKQIQSVALKPEVVDPEDVEMLQDLVLAAVNEALRMAEEISSSEMGKLTGGRGGIPGMF